MNFVSILLVLALLVVSLYAEKQVEPETKIEEDSEDEVKQNTFGRETRQSRCLFTQFQCSNGQCISRNYLCNRRKQCADGSDEFFYTCYRTQTTERYPLHPLTNESPDNENTTNSEVQFCSSGQFFCTSRQCIEESRICDGFWDCRDGSDESPDICKVSNGNVNNNGDTNNTNKNNNNNSKNNNNNHNGNNECQSSQFRCNNGQCIFASAVCDGTAHCKDGSDEERKLCQGSNQGGATTLSPSGSSGNWQQTLRPCSIPPQPANGRWRLHRSQCELNRECNAPTNVHSMDPGSYLVYQCDEGFNLVGNRDVLCGPGGQWIHEPKCEEIRCPDLSSSAMEALCIWNNVAVSCEVPAPVNTFAKLNCREGFVQEVTYSSTYNNVTCGADGVWSPKPINCVRKPKKVKLVLEGDMIIEE